MSVGGHITSGDEVMYTAIKESEEELGIKVTEKNLQFLATTSTSLKGSSPKQVSPVALAHHASLSTLSIGRGRAATVCRQRAACDELPRVQGDFQCNEYKDVFLLEFQGGLSDLNFADNEVSDVKMLHWKVVEGDMIAQLGPGGQELDGPYVPRPRSYIDLLFTAMRAKFPQ